MEPTMGRGRYLLFIVGAAVVSSGAQLAVSYQTGIGFSGVVYAMFGYTLAARNEEPLYKSIIDNTTIKWLLGWLVLCIVLTETGVWNVANTAHTAGLLFGYFVGNTFVAEKFVAAGRLALASLALLTVLAATYMPWSDAWVYRDEIATYFSFLEAAEGGDPAAQYEVSRYLQDGENEPERLKWLRKSVKQGYVPAMNQLAWTLATDSNDDVRNGKRAVKLAERACEADGWKDAAYIDTLAAAYAEMERWEEAVAMQEMALAKLSEKDEDSRPSYEARLQSMLRQEKIRKN